MKFNTSQILALFITIMGTAGFSGTRHTFAQESEPNSKLGSIQGRVLADGQPVTSATVTLSSTNSPGQSRAVPTNDAGDFEIKGLEPGIYSLQATAPAYVRMPNGSNQQIFRVGDSATLNMTRGGVITGRVLTAENEPVVAVRVRAMMIRDVNGRKPTPSASSLDRFTDDRGVYRIFGLLPGTYVVFAGGRGTFSATPNAYDNDAPTYAPSSSRDTAEEIAIASGEERTIDIRYRADVGHTVSGNASAPATVNSPWININLARLIDSTPDLMISDFQNVAAKGFEFRGVRDGDYLIWAQYGPGSGETFLSEPKRITVKGADVTGIELVAKPVASVAGEVLLEPSSIAECKEKRRPLFEETLVSLGRNQSQQPKDGLTKNEQAMLPLYSSSRASTNNAGSFLLRNLSAGQYSFDIRFFARYWYLRSVTLRSPASKESTTTDIARNLLTLKSGDRVTGLKATLAEGAASISGQVEFAENRPSGELIFYLVPAEKDDVLRYFANRVDVNGSFVIDNVPPGRYWTLAKVVSAGSENSTTALRLPTSSGSRVELRQEAKAAKSEIELKPCQSARDHKIPIVSSN